MIEGVMMRSPQLVSVVTRAPGGELLANTWTAPSLLLRRPWLRLPLLRGIVVLYDGLLLGSRALMISAGRTAPSGEPLTPRQVGIALVRSLSLTIALFFILPSVLVRMAQGALRPGLPQNVGEGALRIGLVLAFLVLVGRIPAIRRVFQYHGAEHKAVNAFEAGIPLVAQSIRGCSRFHPRCGTSFLIVVLLVAMLWYAFLGQPSLAARLVERILLLPLVAGASFEILRLGIRVRMFRAILVPGLWLQQLTTLEPDDSQLEVAIRALQEVTGDAVHQTSTLSTSPPVSPGR